MEGIQRNIVREILRESPQHLTPNKDFVAFYVDLLLLDPNWGITEKFFERQSIQNFVNVFISQLKKESIDWSVLQMQFSFHCYLKNLLSLTEARRQKLLKNLSPIKKSICNTEKPKTEDEQLIFVKKIVYYITLLFGLGDPRDEQVFTEVSAALKSVFNETDMMKFIDLDQHGKEKQLLDLTNLVSGVRLFNKDCKKGEAGIPDLHVILKKLLYGINLELVDFREHLHKNLEVFIEVFNKSYVIIKCDTYYQMVRKKDISEDTITENNDLLFLLHQYEFLIKQIIAELEEFEEKMDRTYENFDAILLQAHDQIDSRVAVPVTEAYPIFEKLAEVWRELQDLVVELSIFKAAMECLDDITTGKLQKARDSYSSLGSFVKDLNDNESVSLSTLSSAALPTLSSVAGKKVSVISKKSIDGKVDIKFEYLGFCPWVLVETEGALINGQQRLGIAEYNSKYYIFSSQEAFTEFSKEPEQYIMRVLALARKRPHLITFLNLRDQLEKLRDQCQLVKPKKITTKTKESGSQTYSSYEDIVPPNKDKSYNWNIWNYKQESLYLVDMLSCQTKSTQTFKTHTRKPIYTQTYRKTSCAMQTKVDNYTNTPKPSRYIAGLRGRKDKKQVVMDLTLREDRT